MYPRNVCFSFFIYFNNVILNYISNVSQAQQVICFKKYFLPIQCKFTQQTVFTSQQYYKISIEMCIPPIRLRKGHTEVEQC